MTIHDLPTPALLVDRDALDFNIRKMAALAAEFGKHVRPHAKAHKCVQIARRQMRAGAVGVCVATVAEAELMVRNRIAGVLLTSPIADPKKALRMAWLAAESADTMAVVDHPLQARIYNDAATEVGCTLNILVDLDMGDHRTGIAPGEPALQLARAIADASHLRFAGLQAYSVRASHLEGWEARREFSLNTLGRAVETRELIAANGIPPGILTGGSTGTCEIDRMIPELSELQVGSYVFMDVAYRRIGGVNFRHSLSVLATVVSANHTDRVTVDSGFKAFATDRPFGPEAFDHTGLDFDWAGDEFGAVHLHQPQSALKLGDRIRFIPPHCDPTVNLYDRLHVCRGEEVVDIWAVMDRLPARELTPLRQR
jgi:D-serine deaminase-like pyridoxal phosphate-dependent protein